MRKFSTPILIVIAITSILFSVYQRAQTAKYHALAEGEKRQNEEMARTIEAQTLAVQRSVIALEQANKDLAQTLEECRKLKAGTK
jgi:hypothetical protein